MTQIVKEPSFLVEREGMLTTVQDYGRCGYERFGMPVAGVMDRKSYRLGQYLVGNESLLGALECTVFGPVLRCQGDLIIAFTGANMQPTINGEAAPMYESIQCKSGDLIETSYVQKGMRMYISIAGGIAVEPINNSVSTHIKSKIGGLEGRPLVKGDIIPIGKFARPFKRRYLEDKTYYVENWDFEKPICVVLGPQEHYFTDRGIETFFSSTYTVGESSDRMGYRLEGEPIEHEDGADIISDGTVFGSIQIPADGQPIILMADRQTTGGYTKIGTVITSDLPLLAQTSLGGKLSFVEIGVENAHDLYRVDELALLDKQKEIEVSEQVRHDSSRVEEDVNRVLGTRNWVMHIDGVAYDVIVKELA